MAILSLNDSTDTLFGHCHWNWEEFPYYEWAREAPDSVLVAARKLAAACYGDTDFCSDSLYAVNKADSTHKTDARTITLRFPVQIPEESLLPLIDMKSSLEDAGTPVVELTKCHKSVTNWHIMAIRTTSIAELVGLLTRATDAVENQRRLGIRSFALPQKAATLVINA